MRLNIAVALCCGLLSLCSFARESDTLGTHETIRAQLSASEATQLSAGNMAVIKQLPLKEGDYFQKGQLLVGYDCDLGKAEVAYAKAEVRAAEKTLAAMDKLNKYQAASVLELENARARVEVTRAKLQIEEVKLRTCTEKAPFSGVITHLYVHSHQRVKPGEPVMDIQNPAVLDVEMRVPSKWLTWLRPGRGFVVRIDETGHELKAKVSRIGGAVDAVSQTVSVYGELDNRGHNALPGMSGDVVFENDSNTTSEKDLNTD